MENAIQKASILIEALPYIRSFKNKIVVVKLSGSVMPNDVRTQNVLQDIVFMKAVGIMPILVHGGGISITQEMAKRGLTPKFVEGNRITDLETLEIAKDVLINQISASIVKKISKLGSEATCIWENSYCPLKAEKYYIETKGNNGASKKLDIGFVGKVTAIDKDRFLNLCNSCAIPIVPSIAKGDNGAVYNVNADNVATFIATALGAEKIVFLSNIDGIMTRLNDKTSVASILHEKEVYALIDKKIISEGMLPKALACISAVKAGVKKAHIINGLIPHALLLEIFTDRGVGTQIIV